MKSSVLVVGAGPVGLTAANNLARLGVPVRIIDSRAEPTRLSKALVIWRRSLHTLEPLIPYEQWMNHGRPVGGVSLADNGDIFARLDLQDPATAAAAADAPSNPAGQHMLPPGILITQAQVEAQLEQHLKERYSISVDRSTQLESFAVDESSGQVRCVLAPAQTHPQDAGTGPAGQQTSTANTANSTSSSSSSSSHEEFTASYLIGCDGGHSTVRKMLGVPFPGYTDPDCRFLMMDCTYEPQPGINSNTPRSPAEGLPQADRLLVSTTAVGVVGVFPMPDLPGAVRLIWNAGEVVPHAWG
jgi:NADPH-dependent dioxygenase